jgi:hypothetical protein
MDHDDERDYESEQADERDYRREQEAEWQETMSVIDIMTPGKKFTLEQVRQYVHANGVQPMEMDTVARRVLKAYRKGEQSTLRESFITWRNSQG